MPPRCPPGSRRDKASGLCIKTAKKKTAKKSVSSTKKTRCPAGSKRDASGTCVPKTSTLPKDVQTTLENIESFGTLHAAEKNHLISNIQNGHKKKTLERVFDGAKRALASLLRLVKSKYFVLVVCVLVASYLGYTQSEGKAMAIRAYGSSAKTFVERSWDAVWTAPKIKTFFMSIETFLKETKIALTQAPEKLGLKWKALVTSISTMYNALRNRMTDLFTEPVESSVYAPRNLSHLEGIGPFSNVNPFLPSEIAKQARLSNVNPFLPSEIAKQARLSNVNPFLPSEIAKQARLSNVNPFLPSEIAKQATQQREVIPSDIARQWAI